MKDTTLCRVGIAADGTEDVGAMFPDCFERETRL